MVLINSISSKRFSDNVTRHDLKLYITRFLDQRSAVRRIVMYPILHLFHIVLLRLALLSDVEIALHLLIRMKINNAVMEMMATCLPSLASIAGLRLHCVLLHPIPVASFAFTLNTLRTLRLLLSARS
jgi:hypothetical protein